VPVLNACAQAPEEAATATLDDIANLNPNRPALIKAFGQKLTNPEITKGFENWKKQWKSDVLSKGIGGRRTLEMSKPCEAAVQDFVRKEITGKCPALRGTVGGMPTNDDWAGLATSSVFSDSGIIFYGTTPAWETSTMEKGWLGAVRISLEGTRTIVAYNFEAAHKFMLQLLQGSAAGSVLKKAPDLSPSNVASTFRGWNQETSICLTCDRCV
jgi:hypothetical protein